METTLKEQSKEITNLRKKMEDMEVQLKDHYGKIEKDRKIKVPAVVQVHTLTFLNLIQVFSLVTQNILQNLSCYNM